MKGKLNIVLSICAVLLGVVVLVESIFAQQYLPRPLGLTLIITAASIFLFLIALAISLDFSSGGYECRRCGHRFTPTFGAYIWAMHTVTTRRLRCPKCGRKSFCKRKLD